ncbi:MAG: ATP-binding protein [Zhaonellaceae bacterium]|jgi:two-component sensor histidine kinase|nr:ATP-binding protein [Clostridia bacterium]
MKWRKQASSTLSSLKSLRKDVMDTLASWNICSEDDQFALEVVILELLSNAVKHGNRWQEEKKVKVNMRYLPAARNLILLVCDEGTGPIMVKEAVGMEEEGRGLMVVEALCNKLTVGRGRVWVRKELRNEEKSTNR